MSLNAKEFEKLLYEFCKQDFPESFAVQFDTRVIGEESGNKRQIDTKISGRLGIASILICGEAKNLDECVGSETIDALVGKYMSGEVRANKVILISNKGFTEPAIKRATKLGIELLQPTDLGIPIKNIPHVVGIGYLGQMLATIVGSGPQYSEMAHPENLLIVKGAKILSFQQNVFRLVVSALKQIRHKTIAYEPSAIKVKDENVLYELTFKKGYRYHASFDVEVEIKWNYFVENLPTGVLHHINTNEVVYVNMQGNTSDILNKVLLSPTRKDYESKDESIKDILDANEGFVLHLCMSDPDRNKTNPQHPVLIPI